MSAQAKALGGRIFTGPFLFMCAIAALGGVLMLYRFVVGLGPTTGMNDGYPWGIWIAFDVVTGTALGAGGYGMALIIYVLNRGHYHPLVRPAMVTTALGYTLAGASITIDVGRWYNLWRIPIAYDSWNFNSALLEVALCVMLYMTVSWLEVWDSLLDGLAKGKEGTKLVEYSWKLRKYLRKALPALIALGVLLPTMHQSSLGTIFVLSSKLHPLWHSPFLPLLFLVSCLAMGFGGVLLESAIAGRAFNHRPEWELLTRLAKTVGWIGAGWVVLRLADVVMRGAFSAPVTPFIFLMFVLELAHFAIPAYLLVSRHRHNRGVMFGSAVAMLVGGALYRFDTYLIAFDPGRTWSYFPSVQEILISLALVSVEVGAYLFIVKKFPILSSRPENAHA